MIKKQFQIFIISRLIVSLLILFFYETYNKSGLSYPDLEVYSGTLNGYPPFYKAVNPLFYALTRLMDYTTESFLAPQFITLSLLINIVASSIFIYLSSKIHSYKSSLLFSFIFGCHPYLALYSLKIDTSVFLIFPIGLITAATLLGKWSNLKLISVSLASLFRNASLPLGWILAFKEIRKSKEIFQIFGLIILSYTSFINFNYAFKYIGGNYGCYSFSKIVEWFNNLGITHTLSKIISLFLTPIIHIFLDLGAREAIALYCFRLPNDFAGVIWLHFFSTIGFAVLHGWLLYKLIKFVLENYKINKNSLDLIIPFSILIPTLFGAAHMRYLIPLIPLLLLFIFKFNLKNINY